MKNFQGKNQQQGLALLAALLIIVIFAIMGLTAVRNAKESEKMAGTDVRYGAVFEAGEQTLRRVAAYLGAIDGVPKAENGRANRAVAENFDTAQIKKTNFDFRRSDSFIWSREELRTVLKPLCKNKDDEGECIGFVEEIDNDPFWKVGIKSAFTDNIVANNYLSDIETRTFVEELRSTTISVKSPVFGNSRLDAGQRNSKELKKKSYYLITIKSSGYPPGIANKSAQDARENVIIQAVFVKVD